MNEQTENYYQVLANSPEEQVCELATSLLQSEYAASQVSVLSGPKLGLVMLRVRETVADSQFNVGEVLVTEVRLELDGQFGFGMVTGDSPRRAMAVALLDAALRKGGPAAKKLQPEIARLSQALRLSRQKMYQLVATSQVDFETF